MSKVVHVHNTSYTYNNLSPLWRECKHCTQNNFLNTEVSFNHMGLIWTAEFTGNTKNLLRSNLYSFINMAYINMAQVSLKCTTWNFPIFIQIYLGNPDFQNLYYPSPTEARNKKKWLKHGGFREEVKNVQMIKDHVQNNCRYT